MKKIISVLLAIVMMLTTMSVSVFAEESLSGTCGENLTWTFNPDTGELTISGEGAMYDYYYDHPWESYEDEITAVTIGDGVTSIGNYAFFDCGSLISINISNGVITIGNDALWGCTSLTNVTIPDSVITIGNAAFAYCTSLTNVTIPDSVITIGDAAFAYCTSLTSVTIGNSVTTIGSCAFEYCTSLTNVTIGNSVTTIKSGAFMGCDSLTSVTISNNVTTIEHSAFDCCTSLTSVTIPDSVTTIESWAFAGCVILTDVYYNGTEEEWNQIEIGDGNEPLLNAKIHLTESENPYSGTYGENMTWTFNPDTGELTISGEGAMEFASTESSVPWNKCKSRITKITIGDGITSIAGGIEFRNCDNLTSVSIGKGVTSVMAGAFWGCPCLESIVVDEDNAAFSNDENGVLFNKDKTVLVQYPSGNSMDHYAIPDSVISIKQYAFTLCENLESVTIGSGVSSVDGFMFSECYNLKTVTFSESIVFIGGWTFDKCDSITDIYYMGTQAAWKYVYICDGNDNLLNATVHFSSYEKVMTGNCGENLTWSLNTATGELVISGEGEMYDYEFNANYGTTDKLAEWCFYDITSLTLFQGVKSIGEYAFFWCESLTGVTIPDGVITIGSCAFESCNSLTNVTIGNSVTTIESWAFAGCAILTDVYYNGTEEDWNQIEIGDGNEPLLNATIHFAESENPYSGTCGENLTWSLDVETGELTISGTGKMANYSSTSPAPWDEYKDKIKKLIVADGVTTIGNDTFIGCKNLEEIDLPESITKIGDSAFRDCLGLEDIEIPASVKSLGHYAFYGCDGIKEIAIPEGVKSLGNYAFRNCSNLKSVTLPESLASIGKGAFMECSSLTDAEYNGTDEQWDNVTVGTNNEILLEALKEVVYGDVNEDGKINSVDALNCLNHAVGKITLTGKKFEAADNNGDGTVNSIDALNILNYAVGKTTSFPIAGKQKAVDLYTDTMNKEKDKE